MRWGVTPRARLAGRGREDRACAGGVAFRGVGVKGEI